jgi:ribonuclease VapC
LETSIAIESRKGEAGGRELDLLMYRAGSEVVAVDQNQTETARSACRRYGEGRHPAGLNCGDCFAYARAKCRSLPSLFRGSDFSRTDINWVPVP